MQTNLNIIVTGSTSGIGLATVKNLAKRTDKTFNIFVTSRKLANAEAAIVKLAEELPDTNSTFTALELDLGNKESVDAFVEGLVANGTKIDVLVNNAGINNFDKAKESKEGFLLQWNVNYAHTRHLIEQVLEKDLIQKQGKIINISSENGTFVQFQQINPVLDAQLKDVDSFDLAKLAELEQVCISDHETPEGQAKWPRWVYNSTKVLLNIFSIILGKDPRVVERDIQVFTMCPGWCRTKLTSVMSETAPRSSDEGSQTILYLIDLKPGIDLAIQGKFFKREKLSSYFEGIQYDNVDDVDN